MQKYLNISTLNFKILTFIYFAFTLMYMIIDTLPTMRYLRELEIYSFLGVSIFSLVITTLLSRYPRIIIGIAFVFIIIVCISDMILGVIAYDVTTKVIEALVYVYVLAMLLMASKHLTAKATV